MRVVCSNSIKQCPHTLGHESYCLWGEREQEMKLGRGTGDFSFTCNIHVLYKRKERRKGGRKKEQEREEYSFCRMHDKPKGQHTEAGSKEDSFAKQPCRDGRASLNSTSIFSEDDMFSEISWKQKDKYCIILPIIIV